MPKSLEVDIPEDGENLDESSLSLKQVETNNPKDLNVKIPYAKRCNSMHLRKPSNLKERFSRMHHHSTFDNDDGKLKKSIPKNKK